MPDMRRSTTSHSGLPFFCILHSIFHCVSPDALFHTILYTTTTTKTGRYSSTIPGTFNKEGPLHTNSGCGKERRILIGPCGDLHRQHPFGTTMRTTGPALLASSRQFV